MPILRAATESCIHSFAIVCHEIGQHAPLDASACEEIREEFGRFRVWTGNLGALAKGHSALDWRLRDADVMRSTVLSLLEELLNTLELASALARNETSEVFLGAETLDDNDILDDISLPSDDELDSISQPGDGLSHVSRRVQDLIKDLYKLSFRIRNSTSKPARAIHYKEIDTSSGLDIFGDCFAALDRDHVSELLRSLRHNHPSLTEDDDILVRRFAKANTARRRQFRYWQKHAQKLAITEVPESVIPIVIALEHRKDNVTTQAPPKPGTNTQTSRSHPGKTILTTTEATFFDPKLDLTTLETQSVISFATTARDLEGKPADLPPPPAAALEGQDFVCPYCFVLCPSTHGHGRAWRKHMLQDLQPYSCTYTNCTSADRFYGSRREWLEHEESQHRRVWICRFHPATTFSNQYDFEQHLRQQNHGHVTEAQIKDFASIAQSFAEDARPKCPICLEGSTSIPLFPAHLAHHLERIATFSIPRGIEDEDSTSLASFKAIPRSMSDRLSINSDLSTSSSQDSAASSHHEQSPLTDEIVQWFLAIGDCDLRPPAQPASSLDPALLHALQESPEYTSWYDGTSPGRLVCRADTDARKIMFLLAVYHNLKSRVRPEVPVICAFLRDEHGSLLTPRHILANLIYQLLSQTHAISVQMVTLHRLREPFATGPSLEVLNDVFRSLLDSGPRVYLVLDEPTEANGLLAPLLDPISNAANLSVLIGSSHRPVCSRCERNVVTRWRCKICSGGRFELCAECKDLGRGCLNTYHYVLEVHEYQIMIDVDALCLLDHRKRSFGRAMDSKIAEIQRENPNDDHGQTPLIDEAFERIMSHTIKNSGYEDLAMAAFDVVRHAFWPLKDHQFKIAVRHVLQCRRPTPKIYPTITDMIEATGGLLIVQQDSVITWFHPSLAGYFERSHARWFPSGHANMASACLTVLMSQAIPTDEGGTGNWATGSLFGYAACVWGQHLRACSPNLVLEDMAMRYLEDDQKLNLGVLAAHTLQPEDMAYRFDVGQGLAAAHVCSIFGLTNLLQRLPTAELNREASWTHRTPLSYACTMGHLDTVRFLLDSSAYSSMQAEMVFALRQASAYGHGKVVELLLERGIDFNAKYSSEETSLVSAARMGHTDIVKLLLEHGADVDAKDSGDDGPRETPLISASRRGHVDIVRLLLEHGANPNLETPGGSSALHEAIKLTHICVVETLLESPIVKLVPMISAEGEIVTLLTAILQLESMDILRLALARDDLDIDGRDHNGRTALWWLLSASHDRYATGYQMDALGLIIRHPNCDVNAVDLVGRTYIMRFLSGRILNAKLLDLLLVSGVDINRVDKDGQTAISYAMTLQYSVQITSMLVNHGADLTLRDSSGQGLLHRLVIGFGDAQELQYLDLLLERMPALIDSRNDSGQTPLHLALVLDKLDLAKELLARGTDVNLRDNSGRTLFDVACQLGHTPVVAHLTEKLINESILGTPHEDMGMAALEIASFARRSLKMDEFELALRYLIHDRRPEPVPSSSVVDIAEYTADLLNIQQDHVVFAEEHVSAYLGQTRDRWYPSGQANMAFTCLRVLTLESSPGAQSLYRVSSPLYRYATHEWASHVYAYYPKLAFVEDLAVRYLTIVRHHDMSNEVVSDFPDRDLNAVQFCSRWGLTSTIRRIWEDVDLDLDMDINSQSDDQARTPLIYAASMGHLDTVEILLELGADPYLTTNEGCTALCEALKQDRRNVVEYYLDSPTLRLDTVITKNTRNTALMQIQDFTSIDLIRALLRRPDIDVNESDGQGFTALSHIIFKEPSNHKPGFEADVVRLIVDVPGFNMSAVDNQGRSYAQQLLDNPTFHEDLLLILLEKGIDFEHRDHKGKTAMSYANARHPTTNAPQLLLDHGANNENDAVEEHHEVSGGSEAEPSPSVVVPARSSRRMQKHGLI